MDCKDSVSIAGWVYTLSFAFHKPPTNNIPRYVCASLKKQVALLSIDSHGIPITTATSFRCCSLPDIQHPVNMIVVTIFPYDFSWKNAAISIEGSNDRHIDLYRIQQYHPNIRTFVLVLYENECSVSR